jgi:hypothetical protein
MRYLVLHRALRNAGDFLIRQRATELVRSARPRAELVDGEAWRPLEEQFSPDRLDAFDAIVICGGPGFQRRMHPDIYPLMSLDRMRPPLILLSMGSFFFPADRESIASHRLDAETVAFLRWVSARVPMISTRDQLSADLLAREGIGGATMTGDVAWYAPTAAPRPVPSAIEHVTFTPPANPLFFRDGIDLLRAIRRYAPTAELSVVFHRDRQEPFERAARAVGAATIDISGSVEGFRHYDASSLHIGYRLHAHLYCLSMNIVSYLVAEDSRGVGALQTLGNLGVDPFRKRRANAALRRIWSALPRVGNPSRRATRPIGLAATMLFRYGDPSPRLMAQLDQDISDGFARHRAVQGQIAGTRSTMNRALQMLP